MLSTKILDSSKWKLKPLLKQINRKSKKTAKMNFNRSFRGRLIHRNIENVLTSVCEKKSLNSAQKTSKNIISKLSWKIEFVNKGKVQKALKTCRYLLTPKKVDCTPRINQMKSLIKNFEEKIRGNKQELSEIIQTRNVESFVKIIKQKNYLSAEEVAIETEREQKRKDELNFKYSSISNSVKRFKMIPDNTSFGYFHSKPFPLIEKKNSIDIIENLISEKIKETSPKMNLFLRNANSFREYLQSSIEVKDEEKLKLSKFYKALKEGNYREVFSTLDNQQNYIDVKFSVLFIYLL